MKFAVRSRPAPSLPGVHGPARIHRRTASLLGRLHVGDIAVLDHTDTVSYTHLTLPTNREV